MSIIVRGNIIGGDILAGRLGRAEANHSVERCLKRVERAGVAQRGQVLSITSTTITFSFTELDDACLGATDMQKRVAELPPISGLHLALRVAIFTAGDENIAIRMAEMLMEQAAPGEILCDRDLFQKAAEDSGLKIKDLQQEWSLPKGGVSLPLMEILWRESIDYGKAPPSANPYRPPFEQQIDEISFMPDGTAFSVTLVEPISDIDAAEITDSSTQKEEEAIPNLCVRYAGETIILNKDNPSITLGRDRHNGIIIRNSLKNSRVSRSHARIVLRGKHYTLEDTSTNGTFVVQSNAAEIFVRNTIVPLYVSGIFSLGLSTREENAEILEFEYL
ncbi:MAG: FHA domain-containing protein [Betaproteobacteria bacterium]|nr:FHA domain-containing protein [Betaproteobacteria bacterium]